MNLGIGQQTATRLDSTPRVSSVLQSFPFGLDYRTR